jgi:predicted DsbA family dithiol-disulfide isomerase
VTLAADLDRARLSVLLDVRHPFAYLALDAAIAFGRERALSINWLPLTAPPVRPPQPAAADDDRGVRHRRYRAEAIAREIEVYGAAQGLVLREYYRSGDAEAACHGWLWVRDRFPQRLERYVVELFRGYWSIELDVSRIEPIATLVDALGADAVSFRVWSARDGSAAAVALANELRSHG